MFTTAVLALDLSPAESPVLGCMPALLHWGVKRLVIVHVIRIGYAQGPGYHEIEESTARIEADATPLREAGLQVEVQVRMAGVVADDILASAAEVQAGLVIVGSRSHHLAHRLFLGSVARDVVRRTRLPLLLLWLEPSAEATAARCVATCTDTLRHVMLATDLSRHAAAAEQAAAVLAAPPHHAQAFDALTVLTPESIAETPALPLMARAALQALIAAPKQAGVHCEALVEIGEPAASIARLAADRDVSLIVVGKHGRGWTSSRVIGSTAYRLCEAAGRPVLMVPTTPTSAT